MYFFATHLWQGGKMIIETSLRYVRNNKQHINSLDKLPTKLLIVGFKWMEHQRDRTKK